MKRVYYLLVLCLSVIMSYSQDNDVELSHYIFPEFTEGVVLMKTGIRNKALLNYNSLTEEMVFEDNGGKLAIGEQALEQIDTIFINDRKFIVMNEKFTELVYHSKCDLYVEYKCRVIPPGNPTGYGGTSQTSSVTSNSAYISSGRAYDLRLQDGYEVNPYIIYWLKKDMILNSFMSIRQLRKLFVDKKAIFKAYVKEHDVKYDDQESIVQLIRYLETN